MKPIYKYKKLFSPFITRLILIVIVLPVLISSYFYVGLIFIIIISFSVKNNYNQFSIYQDHLETENLIGKKNLQSHEFKQAKIKLLRKQGSVIFLPTESKIKIVIRPINKSEAIEIIKALENFGIHFTKCKKYKTLVKWSKTKPGEDGEWY